MISNKFRNLSLALIFSAALNIGLIAYFLIQDSPVSFATKRESSHEIETSNGKVLRQMSRLTFRELVSFLTNRSLVEEGYSKRDLAVSALVAYHHFNIEKALSGKPEQVRTLKFSDDETVELYPSLTEDQFEAIIRFAYQEKWPLTAKGLFLHMQSKPERQESLEQAFSHTPEFYAVKLLFQKTGAPQETDTLLNLITEGSWDLLETFAREQTQVLDFSPEKRRSLLLQYMGLHSETAGRLLLQTDFNFALKKLEDPGILTLLSLLKKQSEEGTRFSLELLRSARSNAIWHVAAMTLYSYVGEIPTEPLDPKAVIARFSKETPKVVEAPKPAPKPKVPSRYHIVKDGETLWKISRMYKVKVNEIVDLNCLEKDALYPGMTLKLPPE